jgi:3-dehydroquinate synthase
MSEANFLPEPVYVDLKDRSYHISFCRDFGHIANLVKPFCTESAVVITNRTIWELHGEPFSQALKKLEIAFDLWEMGDGEKYKSVETASYAWDFLIEKKLSRKTCIIAFGGGVVGDLAGFVAATYLRGVPFVQVPTTVVSMVDSSVGGKTGVDHPLGKNLIGAFYQPKAVLMDMSVLQTLDRHNMHGGFAEVIKYGVIYDADFFKWLEENLEKAIALDNAAISHVVRHSCEIKAEVVSQDEQEAGLRAILNYGHTFGHAIEALGEYKEKQFHGQAIAIGMCCAADMAVNLGMMSLEEAKRIEALIMRAALPTSLAADMDPEAVYERMFSDKKVAAGKLRFVLPTRIGHVELMGDIAREDVLDVLKARQR